MTVGDLKKRLQNADEDVQVVIAVPESWMSFKGNHKFKNGNKFHIYESDVGFTEKVNWIDDDEVKWNSDVFIIT